MVYPWRIGPWDALGRPNGLLGDATYPLLWYSGQVASLDIAQTWFDDLDQELAAACLEQVLWDSRPADGHPPAVRDAIWNWLEHGKVLKRSAILVESEMLRVSANLSAVGGRLCLRAFYSLEDAEAWLAAPIEAASTG